MTPAFCRSQQPVMIWAPYGVCPAALTCHRLGGRTRDDAFAGFTQRRPEKTLVRAITLLTKASRDRSCGSPTSHPGGGTRPGHLQRSLTPPFSTSTSSLSTTAPAPPEPACPRASCAPPPLRWARAATPLARHLASQPGNSGTPRHPVDEVVQPGLPRVVVEIDSSSSSRCSGASSAGSDSCAPRSGGPRSPSPCRSAPALRTSGARRVPGDRVGDLRPSHWRTGLARRARPERPERPAVSPGLAPREDWQPLGAAGTALRRTPRHATTLSTTCTP